MVPMAPLGHLNIRSRKDVSAMRIAFLVVAVILASIVVAIPAAALGIALPLLESKDQPQHAGVNIEVELTSADGVYRAGVEGGGFKIPRFKDFEEGLRLLPWFEKMHIRVPVTGVLPEKIRQKTLKLGEGVELDANTELVVNIGALNPGVYTMIASVNHDGSTGGSVVFGFWFAHEVAGTDRTGLRFLVADFESYFRSNAESLFGIKRDDPRQLDLLTPRERELLVSQFMDEHEKGAIALTTFVSGSYQTLYKGLESTNRIGGGAPLQRGKTQLEVEAEALRQCVTDRDALIEGKDLEIADLESVITDITAERDTAQSETARLKGELETAKSALDAKGKELEVAKERAEKLQSALDSANAATDKATEAQKATVAERDTAQSETARLKGELETAKSALDAKGKELEVAKERATALQIALDCASAATNKAVEAQKATTAERDKAQTKVTELTKELAEAKNELATANSGPFAIAQKAMEEGKSGAVIVVPEGTTRRFWLKTGVGWQKCQSITGVVTFVDAPLAAQAKGWRRFAVLPEGEAPRDDSGWEIPMTGVIVTPMEVCR